MAFDCREGRICRPCRLRAVVIPNLLARAVSFPRPPSAISGRCGDDALVVSMVGVGAIRAISCWVEVGRLPGGTRLVFFVLRPQQ